MLMDELQNEITALRTLVIDLKYTCLHDRNLIVYQNDH